MPIVNLAGPGSRHYVAAGGGGDPGSPLFFDDFDYEVTRNQSQSSAEDGFQLAGWNAAALSNGTGASHGYLYTVTSIDGFSGTLPGASTRSLCMESYPNNGTDTSFLQCDYWLQFGDEATGVQGDLPADVWIQYWIYLQDDPGSGHASTYPNRNKFLYPVTNFHPGNSNPGAGDVTIAWLFVMGAQAYESAFGPTNENYIGLQAYGSDKDTGNPSNPDINLHQNLSSKRIAANEWTLVKLHIDISGTQGTFEAWLRAQDEPTFTKVAEWIGGVSPSVFDWPTYAETRAGHKLLRCPTTENANPGNNPARDGDGDHFKYLRDFAMAENEADLPTY